MPEVSSRVEVAASPAAVYAAAKDIEGLVDYITDVESITVTERREVPGGLETVTDWVGLLPEFRRKLTWTEQDRWDDAALICRFEQIKGDFDAYEGEWRFGEAGEGAYTELVVRYEWDVPLIGPLLVKLVQNKVQQSADRIQAGLKQRVEEAAG